ncbi:GGDEF domain-containing protein [Sulfuriflexus mobilis]|uniref:GGDEF domain-containing protein n=1 Tax=Sulfuriflexus mobilis TaxID=1811807 RepID=UPI000F83E2F3|nr:GGDEF domain-containing protein [Sulfuriflexus mobilis]
MTIYSTLLFIQFTTLMIQAIALLVSWRQNPREVGLRDWGIAQALMAIGSLLIAAAILLSDQASGAEPPLFVLLVRDAGVGMVNTGWFLAWMGIRHFYRRRAFSYGLLPVFAVIFIMILLPGAHLPGWRVAVTSLSIVSFSAMIIWELYRKKSEHYIVTHMAGMAMAFVTLGWLARGLSLVGDLQRASGSATVDLICAYSSIVMGMVFTFSLLLMTNQRILQRLRHQAAIDPLTGALNRRAFFEASRPLLAALRRDRVSLALAVVDIDHFKKVNDHYGHAVGDQVLRHFSRLTHDSLREGDLFARYGGEEFVILFQNSSPEQAEQAIDRLRETWSAQRTDASEATHNVKFSAGISYASGPAPVTLESMLKEADNALYAAKNTGRNCTVISQENFKIRSIGFERNDVAINETEYS